MGQQSVSTGLGRIDVGACCTRGARSRRSCGWWGRRRRWGGGGRYEVKLRHGWLDRSDINCVEMFVTLADFDLRWVL